MLKFIWNSWWRNKERFILLMVGMLIVSTGLSYLLGVTQANNGTVVNELQKRWDSSYHIVVRPEGSRSVTEDLNLLEPNYMSGLEGGITRKQYETIQQIADIDVAAPIAIIGSTYSSSFTQTHTFDKAGLYRLKMNTLIDTGIEKINDFQDLKAYFWVGWMPNGDSTHIGIGPTALYEEFPLSYGSDVMLAGIDPVAEAKLVGLNDAVQATAFSRYFNEEDVPEPYDEDITTIPILMSTKDYVDASINYTIIIVTIMYQQFPRSELPFLFATILIPVVTGVLGALLPAERAVRITPAEAIGGHVVNQKQVEKRFRFVLGTTATALVVGIISLFVFTSPEVKPVTEEAKSTPATTAQTTGAKQADLKDTKPKEAKATTPKEDDLQKIMNLGTFQTFIGDPQMKKREFQVGEPVYASPDGTKPEDGKRFVSLPLTLYDKDKGYGGYADYSPNGFRMYTPDGTEYSPVDMINHNKKAFQGGFRYKPGEKSEIDLVFLVPENEKRLVLFASSDAIPKTYTVKIDVP